MSTDCGNSPKKKFIKEFNLAFAEGNTDYLIDCVTKDIVWDITGDKTIEGIEKFANAINEMKGAKVSELTIDKIVTHSKEGAVNGKIHMENGRNYAFADFYEFNTAKSTKIKRLTSYVIKTK